jgi:hypothetical protein
MSGGEWGGGGWGGSSEFIESLGGPNCGVWEARIDTGSAGQVAVTETGGGDASATVNLGADKTYYHSSDGNDSATLGEQLGSILTASALNATYTVTLSLSTGLYTITASGGSVTAIAITWTSTWLRDVLGFTGNLSGALSYVAPRQARALWLPNCPVETPYGLSSDGLRHRDAQVTLAPDGTYKALVYASHVRNEYLYSHITAPRCIQAEEATVNESFETFFDDGIAGDAAWCSAPGKALRWYPDRDDPETFKQYNALELARPGYERTDANFAGFWRVTLPVVLDS